MHKTLSIEHNTVLRPFRYYGAFESTKIHGSAIDVLETTRHVQRWRDDLELLLEAGVRDLRYPAPWHRIEQSPGHFDFHWMDGPMRHMHALGMDPVIDLLHHTSFPDWLEGGFENPEFPRLFRRFALEFARRYEWVSRYTFFNEPLATTVLCSQIGVWYPHRRSDRDFVKMALNVARAIQITDRALRSERPVEHFYIDTCEHHSANDRRAHGWAEFLNHRRYLLLDLAMGKVNHEYPLHEYLRENGARDRDLRRLADGGVQVDVLGLDYYPHSEMHWGWNEDTCSPRERRPYLHARGFANVAEDYVERYRLPVMLSETNIRGTVSDRLTWLRFMHEQSETLADRGADFRGFCWFPSIDSTDWSNLCARCTCAVDPQGIWYLDGERYARYESELSECFRQMASGQARGSDLPAYRFLAPLDGQLAGYLPLMRHWKDWRDPEPLEREAA